MLLCYECTLPRISWFVVIGFPPGPAIVHPGDVPSPDPDPAGDVQRESDGHSRNSRDYHVVTTPVFRVAPCPFDAGIPAG